MPTSGEVFASGLKMLPVTTDLPPGASGPVFRYRGAGPRVEEPYYPTFATAPLAKVGKVRFVVRVEVSGDYKYGFAALHAATKSKAACDWAAHVVAGRAAMLLRRRIATGEGLKPGLRSGTKALRKFGKPAGKTPAVLAYGGTRPLYRSGELLDALTVQKLGLTWVVRFPPSQRTASGAPLAAVAAALERGTISAVTPSLEMRRFLGILYSRLTGRSGRSRGSRRRSASERYTHFVRRVPGRWWFLDTWYEDVRPYAKDWFASYWQHFLGPAGAEFGFPKPDLRPGTRAGQRGDRADPIWSELGKKRKREGMEPLARETTKTRQKSIIDLERRAEEALRAALQARKERGE